MQRPETAETAEYYRQYIALAPDGPVLELLAHQGESTAALFTGLEDGQALHRYAPGKWSVKEVLGHIFDVERTFAYRALAFARRDPHPLPSFEQDSYVENADFDERSIADLVSEFRAVRAATLALFTGLGPAAALRQGIASDCSFTVRSIAWILAGHELHHRGILRERYDVG